MGKLEEFSDQLSDEAHERLTQRAVLMANEHTTLPKKVTVQDYVSIHKNLSNKTTDNYNRLFSIYKELDSKLSIEKKLQLDQAIKDTKMDIENKKAVKFMVLDEIKEKYHILKEADRRS
jgi:hypothetical protein